MQYFNSIFFEICLSSESHTHDQHQGQPLIIIDTDNHGCKQCEIITIHKERARLSRTMYKLDSAKDWSPNHVVRSADLQKIIMLPRMPGIKTAVFTKRIIAFHETFAPLGDCKKKPIPLGIKPSNLSVIWHEAISGRSGQDITNAFYLALLSERDANTYTLWLDNCCAQNKNWLLFTMLIIVVNSSSVGTESIVLKYFEKGHTFMSADSVHHGIEQEMRKRKNIFDFNDFVDVVKVSNGGKMEVIVVEPTVTRNWVDGT